MSLWYTYILKCSDESYYVGSTANLSIRIEDHNAGHGGLYTKQRRPVKLVFYERQKNQVEASKKEREIKGWSRKKKEALIRTVGWKYEFAIAVYAFVRNKKGELLLMKHADRGYWMLPGGGIESGESLEDGLVRELKEEIGQEIKQQKIVGIVDKAMSRQQLHVLFETWLLEECSFHTTQEASEIAFFSVNDLPSNIAERHLVRIKTYLNCDEFPFYLMQ